MISLKFSFIFVELYCLFVITKCAENFQFDISDVISDSNAYFYTTRDLGQNPPETLDEVPAEPVPVKPVYKLAGDFVAELETLLHKITQTFVRIGQKEEGQKTMYHIYDEVFTIASNPVSVATLKYIMQESLKVMQDETASKIIIEFFETVQELMEYDLVDWYFVVPFLYDLHRHPVPEQILSKFKAEVEYILMSEDRKNSFAAAFNLFEEGFSSAATETIKTAVPVEGETTGAIPVPVKQVTQVPIKQEEQVTPIPVKQVKSNQVSVEQGAQVPGKQATQIPVQQVDQVYPIPVKQAKSTQIAQELVAPEQVETVVQNPSAPESTATKVMRRIKSLPASFKQSTVEQVQRT